MGSTCSRVSFRSRSNATDEEAFLTLERLRQKWFSCSTFPAPRIPETISLYPVRHGRVLSLSEICVLHICREIATMELEEMPPETMVFFAESFASAIPWHLVQMIFDVLLRHRLINSKSIQLFRGLPSLESVDLSNLGLITVDMMRIVAGFPLLAHVDLTNCAMLTDNHCALLLRCKRPLETLKLVGCMKLTKNSISPIVAANQKSLTLLWLSRCMRVDDKVIATIENCKVLEDLRLRMCPLITMQDNRLGRVKTLARVDLNGCLAVPENAICAFLNELAMEEGTSRAPEPEAEKLVNNETLTDLHLGWCDISDVTCSVLSVFGNLKSLDLSNSDVTHVGLNDLVYAHPRLHVLKLDRCSKLLRNFSCLNLLEELQVLELNFTKVSELPDQIDTLKHLSLENSGVADEQVERIAETMPRLEFLNLSCCDISNMGLWSLSQLERLHTLIVNDIVRIDEVGILGLGPTLSKSLRVANFSGISFSRVGVQSFTKRFKNLVSLSLDHVDVRDESLRFIHLVRNLKVLNLFAAPVSTVGCKYIGEAGLEHLAELEICGGHIDDAGVMYLCNVTSLVELNLATNKGISNAGVRNWIAPKLLRLRVLNLSYTGVTRDGLECFHHTNQHLEQLSVAGCEGITREWLTGPFRARMPYLWEIVQ